MQTQDKLHLKQHGWVVIPNVIDAKLCDTAKQQMEDYLLSSEKRPNFEEPWNWVERLPTGTVHGGMNRTHAHFQSLWDIR